VALLRAVHVADASRLTMSGSANILPSPIVNLPANPSVEQPYNNNY